MVGDAWLVSWAGEQRVWRIRLPNAQSQLREQSARARSAVFVLARFRSPCVGIDMGGCAWRVGSMCSPRPRYWGFGGRTYVLDWSCPRNWGFCGWHASFDGVCPRVGLFGGEMAVRGDEL